MRIFFIFIVFQYQRLAVFRLGRFAGVRSAGLRILIPFIESGERIDLRTEVINVPRQTNITKDNAPIDVDFLLYLRVVAETAERSILEVRNYRAAVIGLATTTLRAVVGDLTVDEVLSQRERINLELRNKLDAETDRWGVKVTNVEISEILPAHAVQEAMNRQLAAERIRRATITEAEGKRQAAILEAEGARQAAILEAEGSRQASILNAEGHRQAQLLTAEGFALGLEQVFEVANHVDAKTMSLQYFDTLKALGASPSTKWVFPMEFTSMLRPFLNQAAGAEEHPT